MRNLIFDANGVPYSYVYFYSSIGAIEKKYLSIV